MRGIILAGGLGSRFHPVTKVVNKHLLDIFDEPMIFFPIRTLANAGITQITLVTGEDIEAFRRLLGEGTDLNVQLTYAQQPGELGVADALSRAEAHVGKDRTVVVLGDNIFQDDLADYVDAFSHQKSGAKILLKAVAEEDVRRFGVATISDNRIIHIEEKPSKPASNLAVTGCYMYDDRVFDIIRALKPSDRGELEITDVNNTYADAGDLTYDIIKGWWTDAGTPASKLKASVLTALHKGVTFYS